MMLSQQLKKNPLRKQLRRVLKKHLLKKQPQRKQLRRKEPKRLLKKDQRAESLSLRFGTTSY